jgi:hypothetical protein
VTTVFVLVLYIVKARLPLFSREEFVKNLLAGLKGEAMVNELKL